MNILFFMLIGTFGLIAHWCKRWLREQTTASLLDYYLKYNRRATAATAITFSGALFGFLSSSPELTPVTAYAVFLTGYGIDSAINAE
ncbi:hypothetical protein F6R98_09135 [Candidatus Methylospira mobilis]|uniref:Uncharacterized protein n=1 Tax=Candidatus Methylospira mobilis TaxID=1808979 RepID=A0A5Q0BKX2_9GAMM|nr:hypothetical protein [Candidatus Methylospira mobilis]QFY42767.1 hypothetical protein F6R98_09135 [Candidatus Methylospira mobilis]